MVMRGFFYTSTLSSPSFPSPPPSPPSLQDGFLTLEEIEAEFDIFVDSPATNYGHVIHEEL